MPNAFANPRKADDTGDGLTLATAKQLMSSAETVRAGSGTLFLAPGEFEKTVHGAIPAGALVQALQPGTAIITDDGVGNYIDATTEQFECVGLVFKGFAEDVFEYTGTSNTAWIKLTRCRFTEFKTGAMIMRNLGTGIISQRIELCTIDNNNIGSSNFTQVLKTNSANSVVSVFKNNLLYNNVSTATMINYGFDDTASEGMFNNIFLDNTATRAFDIDVVDGLIDSQIGGIDNNAYFGNTFSSNLCQTNTGPKANLAANQAAGFDTNSIDVDPQLVDAPQGVFQVVVGGAADGIGSDGLSIGAHGRGFGLTNNTEPTVWSTPTKTGPGTSILTGDNHEGVTGPDVTLEFGQTDIGAIFNVCRITMEAAENFPDEFINEDATTGKKTVLWKFGKTVPELSGASFAEQEIGTLFAVVAQMRFYQLKPKLNL